MLSLGNIRLDPSPDGFTLMVPRIQPEAMTKQKQFLASCDYWRYGAGGRQENINAICILNLNVINDKVIDTV